MSKFIGILGVARKSSGIVRSSWCDLFVAELCKGLKRRVTSLRYVPAPKHVVALVPSLYRTR